MMICACFDHHTNFCSNIPPGSSRSQRLYFDERLSSSAKLQNKDYSGVWSTPSDIWYGVCSTCCYSAGWQPFDSEPVFRMQKQQYETQLERLRDRENARGNNDGCISVDLEVRSSLLSISI